MVRGAVFCASHIASVVARERKPILAARIELIARELEFRRQQVPVLRDYLPRAAHARLLQRRNHT